MSDTTIADKLNTLSANIQNAYAAAKLKGATIPASMMSGNLSSTIEDIPTKYKLVTAALAEGTYNEQRVLSCQIEDQTITTVPVDQSLSGVLIYFPPKNEGYARDFIVRLEVTVADVPTISFLPIDGTEDDFETDDDSWAEIQAGLNLISFTETK